MPWRTRRLPRAPAFQRALQETNLTPPDRKKKPSRFAWHALAAVLSSVVLASCGGGSKGEGPPLEIRTVSNRADLISDGDALVEISAPPGIVDQGLTITL